MIYEVTLNGSIDFAPGSEVAEIMQNLRTLYSTRKGSVPLDRDFGLSWDFLDKPYAVARNMLIAEIYEATEKYEPRAVIQRISFENSMDDIIRGFRFPRIMVSIGEEEEDW